MEENKIKLIFIQTEQAASLSEINCFNYFPLAKPVLSSLQVSCTLAVLNNQLKWGWKEDPKNTEKQKKNIKNLDKNDAFP